MLNFTKEAPLSAKCAFVHSSLPAFVDENQPPSKRKPFSTFASQTHNYTIDLLLPAEVYHLIEQKLHNNEYSQPYFRVYMSLGDIIEKDFFNKYVKTGKAMMLSEGRPKVDNTFSLQDGVLRLELDRPTYERVGLVGRPTSSGGRKHQKARFLIEIDLRLSSMVHGKKGFNRVQWAFKNVLNNTLSWLFYDLYTPTKSSEADAASPLAKHHPFHETVKPQVNHIERARIPAFFPATGLQDYEYAAELLEWLGLALLDSPRIRADDSIDSYLSRYVVPVSQDAEGKEVEVSTRNLVNIKWRGFMPSSFVEKLFMNARRQAGQDWFALSVCGFQGGGYSVLNAGRDVLTWEWPMDHL